MILSLRLKWPIFPAFILGCLLCYWGHAVLGFSSVISSAVVGLLGSFVTSRKYSLINICPAAIYSGSFAGMCSVELVGNFSNIVLISLLGSLIYFILDKLFSGIGGKLGTVAFTSVALFYLAKNGVLG